MKALLCVSGAMRQGEWLTAQLHTADLVVAVDGGLRHVLAAGRQPDLLLGDLDSVSAADLDQLRDVPVLRFPAEKDQTDLELALEAVTERGATEITVAGALGFRHDHGLTNLLLAAAWRRRTGLQLSLAGDGCLAWPLDTGDELVLPVPAGTVFSVLALESGCRVTISGAAYRLSDSELRFGTGLGMSNRAESSATVSSDEGLLLVMALCEHV